MRRLTFLSCLICLLTTCSAEAGVIFNVSDATFVGDGVTPTTGVIPVEMVVTSDPDALAGDPVLSWDMQSLDVDAITGVISSVSFDSFVEGDLFAGFISVLTASPTAPHTLAGSAVMSNVPPALPEITNGASFFLINFSVPAGESGTFDVVLNGTNGQGLFGVFDGTDPNGYNNVMVSNGTITIELVPEPTTWALLGIASSTLLWGRLRQRAFSSTGT